MSTRKAAFLALAVVLVTGTLWAQEPAQTEEDEQLPTEPVKKIKVLENPYDIASFYRSSQQGPRWGFFGDEQEGAYGAERYPIAGYYRQRPSSRYGYSRFWTNGYGYGHGRGRSSFFLGYGRTIGQNGDLFLMAPTILAPVGPLTGVFYEGR